MMNGYTIDFNNGSATVKMTKAFANKASVYGSNEYRILMGIRKDIPDVKIEVAEKKNKGGVAAGLTYKNMKTAIGQFEDAKERLEVFEKVVALSHIQESPYAYVKDWFKKNYGTINLDENGKAYVEVQKKEEKKEEKAEVKEEVKKPVINVISQQEEGKDEKEAA